MELKQAIALLSNDQFRSHGKKTWTDLGSGAGTFTLVLASLLQPKSIIYAVDTDLSSLDQIPGEYNSVVIKKYPGDFEKQAMPFQNLDGVLMANSLHYIKDKVSFIRKIMDWLKPGGCFLLVEYDMNKANQWVPYPISFLSLRELFQKNGLMAATKLNETPSLFGRANLYSAIVRR